MDYEIMIMNIIVNAGNARSKFIEAIQYAKEGNIDKANDTITRAKEDLNLAHDVQTEFIQNEAAGEGKEVTLLMVHAQDHLMNAMTVRDFATEIVELYAKINS